MEWGNTWLWDSIQILGDENWILDAIRDGTLLAVTDGSYLKEHYPNVCSAAFVLECTAGRGRIIGSFPETSTAACAYRGELLGLMAIHLLLLAANTLVPDLDGAVDIYSDCLGALNSVADLPPTRIPSRCKHSDVLKNILIHCRDFTFDCRYHHVRAHQDDHASYHTLPRPAQLNCQADIEAKNVILRLDCDNLPLQEMFPLEPVAVFVGAEKMTSDTGEQIRFWAHRFLARKTFYSLSILFDHQFDEVDWRSVYDALHEVPRMFAIWACKQVMDIAPTNANQRRYKPEHDPKCPSCTSVDESCGHVLTCEEAGRVDALKTSIALVDTWLRDVGTDTELRHILIAYARARGGFTMLDLTRGRSRRFARFAESQDMIGWRRFMEGMISKELIEIQRVFYNLHGGMLTPEKWAKTLAIKLMEVTHGQWLYRNMQVHDTSTGLLATRRKEELQRAIEDQLELGGEGLDDEDKWLLEINLEDLETTSGETQEYWLLAIVAARAASVLGAQQSAAAATNE